MKTLATKIAIARQRELIFKPKVSNINLDLEEETENHSTCGMCSTFNKEVRIYPKLVDFKKDGMWFREWRYFNDKELTIPHNCGVSK